MDQLQMSTGGKFHGLKILFVVNESHFFISHRLPVALGAQRAGFEVHVAAPDDHVWAPEGFETEQLTRLGFKYHAIPLSRRGTNPFDDGRTFLAIVSLYRKLRPDLVHLLTVKPVLYGGIAARLSRVPAVVAGVTGLGQVFVQQGLWAKLLRAAVLGAYRVIGGHPNSRIVVQNSEDRAVLASRRVSVEAQILLIRGSGVPLDEYRPSPEPAGIPIVILPARLIWAKGVDAFVESARRLKRSGTGARFALVGATRAANPDSVPETRLRAWEEEGVVEWWGRREDMPAVFARTHIVCLPTTYGEGVPRALIEAAASGRPIVATDISGCREVVKHGENGFLVPPGDTKALTDALRRLIDNPGLRQQMGARGRQIAEAEFSVDEVVRRMLRLYEELTA